LKGRDLPMTAHGAGVHYFMINSMCKCQSEFIVITFALAMSISSCSGGGGGGSNGGDSIVWGDWVYEPISNSLVRTQDINGDGASDILAAGYRYRKRSSCIDPTLVDCKEEEEIQEVASLYIQDVLNPGNFLAADVYPLSLLSRGRLHAVDLAVGDLDADGIPDLAIAEEEKCASSASSNCYISDAAYVETFSRYSFGSGGFLSHDLYNLKKYSLSCIAIGDLNADGLQDIAVGVWNTLSLMMNSSSSPGQVFNQRHLGDHPSTTVAIADINNDDLNDVVVTSPLDAAFTGNEMISVSMQEQPGGSRRFSLSGIYDIALDPNAEVDIFNPGVLAYDTAVADLNNDSLPDLVVVARDTHDSQKVSTVSVFMQDPMNIGKFFPAEVYIDTFAVKSVAIGDLNNDLLPDIAAGHESGVEILFQDPQTPGKFLIPSVTYSGMGGNIELEDMNGDDLTDIVGASSGNLYIRYQDAGNPGVFSGRMLLP